MPKWKKDAKEFVVSVYCNENGCEIVIPKPVLEKLGKPTKLRYAFRGQRVEIEKAE